jgi:hypothetical protein
MARNPDPGLGKRAGLLDVKVETREFNKFVKKFVRESVKDTEKIIRRIALDLTQRIVAKTPVLTGRARSGWHLSVSGLGGQWMDEGNDTSMIAKGKTEGGFVNHLRNTLDKYVILINNVYYILILEYGSSSKAPAGFARVSLREMTGKLPKEIKRAYVMKWDQMSKRFLMSKRNQ